MRIPHIIDGNVQKAYAPSPESVNLLGEHQRKIIAENFSWDKDRIPSLADICVHAIKKNFQISSLLHELPCSDQAYLLEILPTNLPLDIAIKVIDKDYYWERRYKSTYGGEAEIKEDGYSWMRFYVERYVRHLVEEAEPENFDEDSLDNILELCCPYVKKLRVRQLQCWKPLLTMEKDEIPEEYPLDRINFKPIFRKLSLIEEFSLVYGMNNVGENFSKNMYLISVMDCQRLGRALLDLKYLKIVKIHRSRLEYSHCRALFQNLMKHGQFTELDLSNCHIGDTGALCVAYLLQNGTNLSTLKLANNGIGNIGSEGLGFALQCGTSPNLTMLDLRLNPLKTDGTMGILRAMVRCALPTEISFAACHFEEDTPIKVCQMLRLNQSLKILNISNNWFGMEGGEHIVEALEYNTTIEWVDFRETGISSDQGDRIKASLARNKKIAEVGLETDIGELQTGNVFYEAIV
ncbi:dynein regulatory complex subunit 5-like [Cylas formicarius]|uniref:dynein regulatory complex subunit 5-like n=1 Tax=Cylas formicarius TaxID=197179 RepID=UPI00295879D6|nr:dynein regulatory complex subunit 5-like [Cylas formicarius]